jgi:phytanoyl-CoA hydroxylase
MTLPDLTTLHLEGNEGGRIPPSSLAWLQPIPIADTDAIRAAYERDGVVHVRGALARDAVLATRAQ